MRIIAHGRGDLAVRRPKKREIAQWIDGNRRIEAVPLNHVTHIIHFVLKQ